MKETPIIMQAESVRAILAGTKTQTRRVINVRSQLIEERDDGTLWPWRENFDTGQDHWYPCPYGRPGDLLYVKEAWQAWKEFDALPPSEIPRHALERVNYLEDGNKWDARYRHARFMPRWASRIDLELLSVRVERLQDISEEDAIAEGIFSTCIGDRRYWQDYRLSDDEAECSPMLTSPIESYRSLWEKINGPGSWHENPFVWRLEFRRVYDR
jgi:hypothetical protein